MKKNNSSTTRAALLTVVLTSLLFAATASHAAPPVVPIDLHRNFSYGGKLSDSDGNVAHVRMDLRVHLSTLMGEPVSYCTGRWQLDAVEIAGKFYPESLVPADVWRGVDLVGVNFAFPMDASIHDGLNSNYFESAYLPCDPGVFYPHGDKRASFNVPGSPSWNRLLLGESWRASTFPFSEERAKAATSPAAFVPPEKVKSWLVQRKIEFNETGRDSKKGTLVDVYHLISGSVNLWSVRGWVEEQERLEQAKRRENRLNKDRQAGVARSKLDEMFAEVDSTEQVRDVSEAKSRVSNGQKTASGARNQRSDQLQSGLCGAETKGALIDETSLTEVAAHAMKLYTGCDRSELTFFRGDGVSGFKNNQGVVIVSVDSKRGWINSDIKFSDGVFPAWATDEEMSRLGLRGRANMGYMNLKGEWEITPQWEFASGFSEGMAHAGTKSARLGNGGYGDFGIINRKGKWVTEDRYSNVSEFSGGYAAVTKDPVRGGYYLIDKNGSAVFEKRFLRIEAPSQGLAVASFNDTNWSDHDEKEGFIDIQGNWVVQPKYKYVGTFSEGLSWVCDEPTSRWGIVGDCNVIDLKGNQISTSTFRWPVREVFKGGLLITSAKDSNKDGFIDRFGNWVIEPRFSWVTPFQNGVATGMLDGECVSIDRHGNRLEAPRKGFCAEILSKRR